MRRWLHLTVLRHHVVRSAPLGDPTADVWGRLVTCSCTGWWVETYWRKK